MRAATIRPMRLSHSFTECLERLNKRRQVGTNLRRHQASNQNSAGDVPLRVHHWRIDWRDRAAFTWQAE